MPSYRYEALSPEGELVRGELQADSEEAALAQVRTLGLFVQRCEPVSAPPESDPHAEPPLGDGTGSGTRLGRSRGAWKPRQEAVLLLSFFALGGLFFAGLGTSTTWRMTRQLATARQTSGIVRSARVVEEPSSDSDGSTYDEYLPVIEYEYEVDGRTYSSDKLYPGGDLIRSSALRSRVAAENLERRYVPGTQVVVWFVPHDPQTAFLVRLRRVENGLFAVSGAILAAVAAGLLLPLLIRAPLVRFGTAAVVFLSAQLLTALVWRAFLAAPRVELNDQPDLLSWLLLAFVLICWMGLIASAPPLLDKVREATFASLLFGVLFMSLSLFVLVPLHFMAPQWGVLRVFPWIGVTSALLSLIGWHIGVVTLDIRRSKDG